MINKKNLVISIKYVTNFNPIFYKNFDKFKYLNKNKIYCRNFFIFIFLLKYINKFNFCKNVSIFIKPFKKNFINILKAPYKNKLSRHQISVFRYNINFKVFFFINMNKLVCYNNLFMFIKKVKYFFNFLDSNLIYKNKINILFNFKLLNFFFLKNFKN